MRIGVVIASGSRADPGALIAAYAAARRGHDVILFADRPLAPPAGWRADVRGHLPDDFADRHAQNGFDYVAIGGPPGSDFFEDAGGARLLLFDAPDVHPLTAHGGLLLARTPSDALAARARHRALAGLRCDIWSPEGDADAVSRRLNELLWRSFEAIVPLPPAPGQIEPLLPAIALGTAPTDFPLARRAEGDGWSSGEEWGQWSIGATARLAIALPDAALPGRDVTIRFNAAAAPGGSQESQTVAIRPLRGRATQWSMPRDVEFREYAVTVPFAAFRRGRAILEFRIADPAPLRRDGRIVDQRLLGLAISRIWLG